MTVDEIAKRANVSKATVSRVINESGYVSKEKREKVLSVLRILTTRFRRTPEKREFGGYIQLEWWYQR